MAVHNEDSRVKIPTIFHFVPLRNYNISLKTQKKKWNSNIFIDTKDLLVSNKLEVK
jgi:hypothetical protein